MSAPLPAVELVAEAAEQRCNFCLRERPRVRYLVEAEHGNAHICDECLVAGLKAIAADYGQRL